MIQQLRMIFITFPHVAISPKEGMGDAQSDEPQCYVRNDVIM
jgi:hypothetical protein